jgi:hypothetical protein
VVIVDVLDDDHVAADAAPSAERVVEAVSGEARVAKGVSLDLGEGPGIGADMSRAERRALKKSSRSPRPRRVTWRLLLFIAAVLGVIGIGAAAITYYGRHTYFVGFDADAVVIFRGRPGGVLWIEPRWSSARTRAATCRLASSPARGREGGAHPRRRPPLPRQPRRADRRDGVGHDHYPTPPISTGN